MTQTENELDEKVKFMLELPNINKQLDFALFDFDNVVDKRYCLKQLIEQEKKAVARGILEDHEALLDKYVNFCARARQFIQIMKDKSTTKFEIEYLGKSNEAFDDLQKYLHSYQELRQKYLGGEENVN